MDNTQMENFKLDNSQFFYRTIPFMRKEGEVVLVDAFNLENTKPLDEWLGVVVSLADGHHTVQQVIDFLGSQYPVPPENLEQTLHSVLERLQENHVVALSQRIVTLPYYLSGPIDELDIERVRSTIQEEQGSAPDTLH